MKKQNDTKKKETKVTNEETAKKVVKKRVNGHKIAIIALLCCAVALVVTAICIGALSGLDDVPSSSSPLDEDEWTNNY